MSQVITLIVSEDFEGWGNHEILTLDTATGRFQRGYANDKDSMEDETALRAKETIRLVRDSLEDQLFMIVEQMKIRDQMDTYIHRVGK